MRIALIDVKSGNTLYPIQFLKIGTILRDKGETVEVFQNEIPRAPFDEYWFSVTFTFDTYLFHRFAEAVKGKGRIRVGGVAPTLLPQAFQRDWIDVHQGMIPEAEDASVDLNFALIDKFNADYSIAWTSRGCVRKCKFCAVPRMEPRYETLIWKRYVRKGLRKIIFYDNNWLAKSRESLQDDIETIKMMRSTHGVLSVDFNQGLDARLMTEDLADIICQVRHDPIRFAYDGKQEEGFWQRAVAMMVKRGVRSFNSYVLYNFHDDPADLYFRIREHARLSEEIMTDRSIIKAFPMKFQPLENISKEHIGEKWTERQLKNFKLIISFHGRGVFACSGLNEFEYWFGRDASEFIDYLMFDNLKRLLIRKRVYLRENRDLIIDKPRIDAIRPAP